MKISIKSCSPGAPWVATLLLSWAGLVFWPSAGGEGKGPLRRLAAWHPPFNLVWLLLLLAFVFFDLVMKLIRCLASQDHKHMQAHQAEDALTDASAITVSFLLVQAVCYHMSTECDPCYGSGRS